MPRKKKRKVDVLITQQCVASWNFSLEVDEDEKQEGIERLANEEKAMRPSPSLEFAGNPIVTWKGA